MITVEQYKTWAGISDSSRDAEIQQAIDLMTGYVEKYCGRGLQYVQGQIDKWHPRDGNHRRGDLALYRFPIATLTSVSVDGTDLDVARFTIDEETGRIWCTDQCLSGAEDIVATYDGGYQTTPVDLEMIFYSLVHSYLDSKATPISNTARSVTIFDFARVDYGSYGSESADLAGLLTPWLHILDLYRSDRVMQVA